MWVPRLALSATVALSLTALPAAGQQVERLSQPVATFPEPFSTVSGLRELSDGRLVVSDRLEKAVRFLDLRAGTMEEIGRMGGGPGEYQMPAGLLPLPGDSTLLVDLGNMRMSLIAPDGRIVRSTAMMRENVFARPTAADRDGGLYFDQGGVRVSGNGGVDMTPQAAIVRMALESDRLDTVGFLPLPASSGRTQRMSIGGGGSGNFSVAGGLAPYAARDVWAAAPDGRIAIVHAEPYHVEWIAPGGAAVAGPTVAYDPVRITDADKAAWADRMSQGTAVMVVGGGAGGGGRSMRMPRPDVDEQEWPEFKAPFGREAATVTPEGALWVQRLVAFGEPQTFDIFDGRGRRVKQVVLPEGRQLAGFGPGKLYLVHVDADDLQWLEMYAR